MSSGTLLFCWSDSQIRKSSPYWCPLAHLAMEIFVMKARKVLTCVAAAFAAGSVTLPSIGQEAAPSSVDHTQTLTAADMSATSGDLDAITVTAQRHAEHVENVPISISVMSSEEFHEQRIQDLNDFAKSMPGISFDSGFASEGLTKIQIRGVSSDSGASTTGIYLDDVSITINNLFYEGASLPKLFDLDHIEVLRGPQGTLWGDSSEGGTVRFLSQAPNMHEFSGEASADVSTTKHGGINTQDYAVINTPIQDGVFAVRTSVGYDHESGYIDNYTQAGALVKKGVNTENTLSLHVVGKLTLPNDLTITPAFFYQKVSSGDNSAFYLTPSFDSTFTPGMYQQDKLIPESGTDTMYLPSLTVSKGLPFADLTSVTGVFVREHDRQEDGTFYNSTTFAQAFLDPLYPSYQPQNDAIIANLPSPVEFSTHYRQISQEIRLASRPEDKQRYGLQWIAGVYYADQWMHNTNFQQIQGINTAFQNIYGYSMNDPVNSLVYQTYGAPGVTEMFPNNIDESDNRTYTQQQYAVFGQLDYDVKSDLHTSLGARYSTSKEDYKSTEIGFFQIGNISPYYQTASYEAFTPKASVDYDINTQSRVYASVAKGFRTGGPTGPIVFGPTSVCNGDFQAIGQTTQPTKFGSDSLWTYELGTKNRVPQGKFTFDAAAFLTQWSNIQQQIYLPTCGYYFTTNVGNAKIYGGEVEAAFRPTAELKLALNGSMEHAVVTSTTNASVVGVGAHLIDVPNASYNAMMVYTHALNDTYTLTTRADYAWTGHSNGSYQASSPNYNNPSYGSLDASMKLTANSYDVSLYIKNLLNNEKIIQSPQINTVTEGFTLRPRTIGVSARYWF